MRSYGSYGVLKTTVHCVVPSRRSVACFWLCVPSSVVSPVFRLHCEPRPRKNNTDNVRGDSGRPFLLRVLYNAVWWAQSYSPDPPLPPPPIHTSSVFSLPANKNLFGNPPSSTTLKIACTAKAELPKGAFYYAYITIEKVHDAVWWTQSYSPDPPLPPPPIHTA